MRYTAKLVLHTSMSCSKWLVVFTSNTISSPLMRRGGTARDKEKSLVTVSCEVRGHKEMGVKSHDTKNVNKDNRHESRLMLRVLFWQPCE